MRERRGHGAQRGGRSLCTRETKSQRRRDRRAGSPRGRTEPGLGTACSSVYMRFLGGCETGSPRRCLLLCSLPPILAPGNQQWKDPSLKETKHSQGGRATVRLGKPPGPFLDRASHQCFHFQR